LSAVADDDLLEAAHGLVRLLQRTIASALQGAQQGHPGGSGGPESSWVDQHQSSLSVRQHCKAVRRRRAEGKGGAAIQGRRYLLTREALWEEMGRSPKPGLRKCGARNAGPAGAEPSRHETVARDTAEKLRQLRKRG
jgi:hypothetical protein